MAWGDLAVDESVPTRVHRSSSGDLNDARHPSDHVLYMFLAGTWILAAVLMWVLVFG